MSLWFEITARTPPFGVETVAAIMRDAAPGGVTIEEPVDILGPEQGFGVRPEEPVLVRVYLPSSELGAVLTEELRQRLGELPGVDLTAKPLYEQDWAVSWREFFGVVEAGRRMVVVPSWVEHEARPGEIVIRLDPGQAFGTGHHETTRLCLGALEDFARPGIRMLDAGTGSGILSIAAVGLGARAVVAIDIDPVAAEVARANVAANGAADEVEVRSGTLTLEHEGRYDLVVANVSTEANIGMAPAFARVVEPGGVVLLSGILSEDAPRLDAAMRAHGFTLESMTGEGDWALLAFRC